MVCTELYGCSLKLKLFSIPFFDPYKKPNGGEGRGGRNRDGARARFLLPVIKKAKDLK